MQAVDYGVRKIWEHNNVGVICLQLSYLFVYAHKLLVLIFQMEYTTYVCLRCWSLRIGFLCTLKLRTCLSIWIENLKLSLVIDVGLQWYCRSLLTSALFSSAIFSILVKKLFCWSWKWYCVLRTLGLAFPSESFVSEALHSFVHCQFI